MPDEISRFSAELARDPAGVAWVALADALRRAGRLRESQRVAVRGLERHPYLADGHDVLARALAEQGDGSGARDEWEMALRIDPRHLASLKGLGFLAFASGDTAIAARLLREASAIRPGDAGLAAALEKTVAASLSGTTARGTAAPDVQLTSSTNLPLPPRSPTPLVPTALERRAEPRGPRDLFTDLEAAGASSALLVDQEGLVLAGRVGDGSGADVSDVLAAELSGLGDDAARALDHLALGEWESILMECDGASLSVAPVGDGALVLLVAPPTTPLGLARMLLARADRHARQWLEAL